jgi:hypothetical protein
VDAGAGLRRLPGLKGGPVDRTNLGGLPGEVLAEALSALPMRADVVMSSCVLSQIVHTCHRELGHGHPDLTAVACALVVAHMRLLATLVKPEGVGVLVTDTVTSETCALDELWQTPSPMAFLERLEAAGGNLSGTGPAFLRRLLRTDQIASPLVGDVRLIEPWLWHLDGQMTLLAYALTFRHR